MDNETNWDAGATTWDRDWDGPGTRTRWDLIPAALGYAALFVWQAPGRVIEWSAGTRLARWLAAARRVKW